MQAAAARRPQGSNTWLGVKPLSWESYPDPLWCHRGQITDIILAPSKWSQRLTSLIFGISLPGQRRKVLTIWIDILHTLRWTVACSHAHVYTNVTDSEVLGSLVNVKQTTPLFLCYNLNTVSNNLTVCVHTKHAGTHTHTLTVRMQVFRFLECIFLLMMV